MAQVGLRLKVIEGPDAGTQLNVERIGEGAVSIGREVDPDRDLLLEHDQRVSRLHAVIETVGDGFQLVDRSRNGTMCNGELLTPNRPVRLKSGDRLHFGPETVAIFELIRQAEHSRGDTRGDPSSEWQRRAPSGSARRPSTPVDSERPRGRESEPPPDRRPASAGANRSQADPSPRPEPPPARPVETFAQFAVHRVLAESDADRVDYAVDEERGTPVALKRFNSALLLRSFRRDILEEVGRARGWRHPGIANVVAAGEHGGTLYVATEYIDGVSVAELHRDHAADIDSTLAAYIGREACAALAYILEQDAKFVHRYLTPRCFMAGRDGRVVLINFGSPPMEVRIHGLQSGNRFLANEARQNRPLDARSDVCSLGRVLFELLSQQEINLRVPTLPDVKTLRTDIPKALQEITNRAVKINPPMRYPSAVEMAEALTGALRELDPGFGAAQVAQWMKRHCPPS